MEVHADVWFRRYFNYCHSVLLFTCSRFAHFVFLSSRLLLQPLFAFRYKEVFPADGWKVYDPLAEYKRQVASPVTASQRRRRERRKKERSLVVANHLLISVLHIYANINVELNSTA